MRIPKQWIKVKLPEIANLNMGQSPSNHDVNENGEGIAFLQGKAEFGKLFPTARKFCTAPKKVAQVNDVLLSVRAPVGPTNLADRETAIGRGLAAISVSKNNFNYKYLLHYFRSIEPWLSEQGTGTTFKAISSQFLKELDCIVPPLVEQKIIANKLDILLAQVETIKASLEHILNIFKRFRQAVLTAAISGKLTSSNCGIWQQETLMKLTTKIGSGATPKGGDNTYKKSGIPLVRSLNIYTNFIKYENLAFIDEEQANKLANVEIEEDDILLNITGASIGRVNLAPEDFIGGRVNQHVTIIRCIKEKLVPKYLYIYLASPCIQKWIEKENYGATRQALTKGMIEQILIVLPPLEEQTEIVQRVEGYLAFADTIEQKTNSALKRVNNLTQSILAKAFRGELTTDWRVANPDLISGENSAEALLKKIKIERETLQKQPKTRIVSQKKDSSIMMNKLINVLEEASDWIAAQEAFRLCGVTDGTQTERIEELYSELRGLDKVGRLQIDTVTDEQGRKLYDRLKLTGA